eukprot:COSAG02_NODE_3814_length_6192_cov_3.474971_4_plen_414_part_00
MMQSKHNASLTETFSLAMWVEPDCPAFQICMLADTRNGSAAPLLGLLPSNDSSTMEPYFYPAPGSNVNGSPSERDNLASGLRVELGQWSFIGVSVTCCVSGKESLVEQGSEPETQGYNCTAQFFVNGKASTIKSFPRPSNGFAAAAHLKLTRFIGSYRAFAAFPGTTLGLAEANAWANQYAASLSLPQLLPKAAQRPVPKLLLDPAQSDALKLWQSNAVPVTDVVRPVKSKSGSGLLLCGQGSAGVDIPFLSGATGEKLHAKVRFRLAPFPKDVSIDATMVDVPVGHAPAALTNHHGAVAVVTIGESRRYAQIAVVDRYLAVLSAVTNTSRVLSDSPVALGTWHLANITIEPTTGLTGVSIDGGDVVAVNLLPLQSVWMYVGEGYRTLNVTSRQPTACVEFDLTAMDTTVVKM